MQTDIPYLEPLLIHLRKDETLKEVFTEKSFFMPKADLISGIDEAMKTDCPAPRALWIIPGDTLAQANSPTCLAPGLHSFVVMLFVQCMRDPFQLVLRDTEVKLEGNFMELAHLRRLVKRSINNFNVQSFNGQRVLGWSGMTWRRDQNLYPGEEKFLATAIEYTVNINY